MKGVRFIFHRLLMRSGIKRFESIWVNKALVQVGRRYPVEAMQEWQAVSRLRLD
jgi:hypothetical protein